MCKSTSKLIVSLNKPSSYWLFTNSQTEIFIQQVSSNLCMNYTSYVPCRIFSNMYSLFSYPTVQEVSVSLFCQYLINTHTVGSYPAESMLALQLTIAGNTTHTKPNQTENSERPMCSSFRDIQIRTIILINFFGVSWQNRINIFCCNLRSIKKYTIYLININTLNYFSFYDLNAIPFFPNCCIKN